MVEREATRGDHLGVHSVSDRHDAAGKQDDRLKMNVAMRPAPVPLRLSGASAMSTSAIAIGSQSLRADTRELQRPRTPTAY
jgi:hypothetical protein